MADRRVLQSDALTRELRTWLHHRAHLPGAVVATTLAYELAALIARHADSLEAANALIDSWAATMKDQVRRLGVGLEHP